jgi:hypothetical protein
MSGMRAAAGAVGVGIMGLTLCVRPGDDGIIVTAVSRAAGRIIELTGAHEALAVEREPRTVRSNSFYRTDRMRRTDRTV